MQSIVRQVVITDKPKLTFKFLVCGTLSAGFLVSEA